MLARALLIAVILGGLYLLIRKLRRSRWSTQLPRVAAMVAVIAFLLLLTLRGGAEIAMPLFAVLVPLLIRWLRSPTLISGDQAQQGDLNQSAVTTRFLSMSLDHSSGVLSGQVREGRFAGRSLQELSLTELLALWRDCQVDPQSVAILETYLDRQADPTWREHVGNTQNQQEDTQKNKRMDRIEAYEILGLQPGASRDEIQAAYRRLIQRVHPDQGGSSYLAARINQARDVLLQQ